MTTSLASDSEMLGLIANIRSGVDDAAELINGIIDGINSVLGSLPPEQVGGVRDGVVDLQRMFNEGITRLGRALDHAGDPEALRAAGAAWATDIGGSASRLAGLATDNATQADDHWTGDAAEAYGKTLLPQRLALTAIKTTGDQIDAVLNELANAIINFWKEVLGAILTLVSGLAIALAGVVGVITAPMAALAAAGLLAAFNENVINQTTVFTDLNNEISIRSAALRRSLNDYTAFPEGAWPRSTTTVMSDGSITDGDDAGWHIR